MTQAQIIEGNKLIAQFDGWAPFTISPLNGKPPYEVWSGGEHDDIREGNEDEMLYHTSWDWLMPVVEKIEGMGQTIVEIGKRHCRIQPILYEAKSDSMVWQIMHEASGDTKLQAVYSACIDFIKWHNIK